MPPRTPCCRIVAQRLALLALTVSSACSRAEPPLALTVIGTDYAFLVPDTVPAGMAVVTFENRGRVPHELVLARIRHDVSSREFADSLSHGARMVPLRATGSAVIFASPGRTNELVRMQVDFKRGERYAFWCQLVDSAGAQKHNVLGMFKLVSVR